MISRIQAPSLSASIMVFRLHHARIAPSRSGASSAMLKPSSQGSLQNRNSLPSPSLRLIERLKKLCVRLSVLSSIAPQGCDGSMRCNHNHRRCSAIPIKWRSKRLKPPSGRGLCTWSHLTKHLPLWTAFVPDKTKIVMILCSAFRSQGAPR
jgi:hypothetical protein